MMLQMNSQPMPEGQRRAWRELFFRQVLTPMRERQKRLAEAEYLAGDERATAEKEDGYDEWLATQEQFDSENEYDEGADR